MPTNWKYLSVFIPIIVIRMLDGYSIFAGLGNDLVIGSMNVASMIFDGEKWMEEFNKKSLEKSGISFQNKFLEKFRKEYSKVNPCGNL